MNLEARIEAERNLRTADEALLCWTPGTPLVAVVPWPDVKGLSNDFQCTDLACWAEVRAMNFQERKAYVLAKAITLMVRDRCDMDAVHFAMLELREYRAAMPDDAPHVISIT